MIASHDIHVLGDMLSCGDADRSSMAETPGDAIRVTHSIGILMNSPVARDNPGASPSPVCTFQSLPRPVSSGISDVIAINCSPKERI